MKLRRVVQCGEVRYCLAWHGGVRVFSMVVHCAAVQCITLQLGAQCNAVYGLL